MNYYRFAKPSRDSVDIPRLIAVKGRGKPYSIELKRYFAIYWLCWYKYAKKEGNEILAKDNMRYFVREIMGMYQ